MLDTKTLRLHLSTIKFALYRVGPNKTLKIVNKVAKQVEIPSNEKHNIFHISHLTFFQGYDPFVTEQKIKNKFKKGVQSRN